MQKSQPEKLIVAKIVKLIICPFLSINLEKCVFARIHRGHVVDTRHMLGLDQEREELGEIMSCIYLVIHLLTMFVCMNYYSMVILLAHNY